MTRLLLGVIRSFDAAEWTADVEVTGAVWAMLSDVPLAWHLREDLVDVGTRCVVVLPGLTAAGAVVLTLYGGRPADDPLFDPGVGHRHRGLLRDGPLLS